MKIKYVPCNNRNYKKGRTDKIKYIVIHYTAGNGDTAKNNVDYYKNNAVSASAHYFVDEYDTVYQSVTDGDTAWAVGASKYVHPYCRNANSISIELCSRNYNGSGKSASDSGWYFKEETVNNAALLTKELMKRYGISPENVIRHYDVTGKICPAPFSNDVTKWNDFKRRISQVKKLSYDETVNNMILDGITTIDNMAYWEKVLGGREAVKPEFLRAVLDRYHGLIN